MLAAHTSPCKPSSRNPFRAPPWDEHHPDFQRIDAELEPDHPARWLKAAVARLDLEPGFAELKGHRGMSAFRSFGGKRARAQAGLTILANNALSIVRALRRRDRDTKPPPRADFQAA